MKNISRRQFLKDSLMGAAAFAIVPGNVLGKTYGFKAPSDKLNIAGIGVGGVGRRNMTNMNTENIVALCDVDWKYAMKTFNDYPKAKRFKDWREMFDRMGKSIDAVMIATPDHTHAVIAAHAMTLGKHVYLQKPLTHSVYEARLLTKLAKKYKVATQMGNQGSSFEWNKRVAEWIWAGEIGEVREVHCWTDRPIWPQGLMKPTDTPAVPDTLDWPLWIGPAEMRPYHPSYCPWNWRGWYDFGTGALGDMACHIMDPAVLALGLKYPTKVIASSTLSNLYSPPYAETITYTFPARPKKGNVEMPELKLTWYDGGLMPPRPEELLDGEMLGDENGGILIIGSKGKIMTPHAAPEEPHEGLQGPRAETPPCDNERRGEHLGLQRPRAGLDSRQQGVGEKPRADVFGFRVLRAVHRNGGHGRYGNAPRRSHWSSQGTEMGRRKHEVHQHFRQRQGEDCELRRFQGDRRRPALRPQVCRVQCARPR